MKEYSLAIVGATGLVGRTILEVLEEKKLPISKYTLFASSKSAGKIMHFMDSDYVVKELNENSFDEGFDFAIFSAGGDTSKKYAPIAASKGTIVIDNSSAFRMDPNVPLVIPEVNPEEIENNKGIIANPNCSTIQALVALKPLDTAYTIKRIVYSTYQAVSGAGNKGVADLDNGIFNYSNKCCDYALQKFPYPIFNNCLPHIDVFLDNGYSKEEEKMINETRKILKKPDLKITATTVRVPVFNSHSESINVEFEKDFKVEELRNLLAHSPGITVIDNLSDNKYPLCKDATGSDNVYVGRIRRDYSVDSGVNLWVVADNLRKGAASNAIQILEFLLSNK